MIGLIQKGFSFAAGVSAAVYDANIWFIQCDQDLELFYEWVEGEIQRSKWALHGLEHEGNQGRPYQEAWHRGRLAVLEGVFLPS